jgi:hypothetical protein
LKRDFAFHQTLPSVSKLRPLAEPDIPGAGFQLILSSFRHFKIHCTTPLPHNLLPALIGLRPIHIQTRPATIIAGVKHEHGQVRGELDRVTARSTHQVVKSRRGST